MTAAGAGTRPRSRRCGTPATDPEWNWRRRPIRGLEGATEPRRAAILLTMSDHMQTGESDVEARPADADKPATTPKPTARRAWPASLLAGYWVWLTGLVAYALVTSV